MLPGQRGMKTPPEAPRRLPVCERRHQRLGPDVLVDVEVRL
jgi:hypothetical protein